MKALQRWRAFFFAVYGLCFIVRWILAFALLPVAILTWKFGRGFLLQFFISPFQFFILVPWLIAYFSVRCGKMPMRSGPPLRRDENPAAFWMNVKFSFYIGALCYLMNLGISWVVLARHR